MFRLTESQAKAIFQLATIFATVAGLFAVASGLFLQNSNDALQRSSDITGKALLTTREDLQFIININQSNQSVREILPIYLQNMANYANHTTNQVETLGQQTMLYFEEFALLFQIAQILAGLAILLAVYATVSSIWGPKT